MKPNFALILSSDHVSLVHRSDTGWVQVGDVALDLPNGEAALARLKDRAHALPGDHSCKLVIPDDQIKYLTFETESDPDEAVRAALKGATPYAVDDLEYDWTADDGVIHVAAVALETLAEAEGFAVQHGFEPVCFAAIPGSADFQGEPFFGVTKWAIDTLPDGTNVERDDAPIHITGDAQLLDAEDKAASDPTADPDPDSVASAATRAVAEAGPAPKRGPLNVSAPPPVAGTASKDASDKTPAIPAAEPPAKTSNKPPFASAPIRASRSGDTGTARGAPLVAAPPLGNPDRSIKAQDTSAMPPLPSPASEAMGDKARLDELAANLKPDPETRLDRDLIAQPPRHAAASPAKPAVASPRKAEKQQMTTFGARKDGVRGKPRFLGLILTAILLLFLVGVAAWASAVLDDGLARFFGRGDDFKLANVPTSNKSAANVFESVMTGDAQDERPEIRPLPKAESTRTTALRQVTALPDRASPLSPNEAMARYAATGIWQMAPASPEIPAAGVPLDDLYQVSLDPSVALGASASLPRRIADARDTTPETPAEPPPAGTRFDFDGRGLVRATPKGTLTPEGIRVFAHRPALTPPADMAQTVTITAKASSELIEDAGLDAQEGEIVTLTGDPSLANVRPRVRPVSALSNGTGAQSPEVSDAAPQGGDSTRPPSGSKAQIASTASTAAFVGDPSHAALRPRTRPDAVSAIGATLQSVSGAASAPRIEGAALGSAAAVVTNDQEALDDEAFENATEQAVSASLTPLRRPSDFESIINRTRKRAAEQPAQPAPKAQPVAPVRQMQPSLPSSASVSNQATDKNVLNLRQVNLIGVYGTTASRRALVRLGNGRFQKVSVGDTLDGGQVAAIGETELHYIKRGRKLVLRMPQS